MRHDGSRAAWIQQQLEEYRRYVLEAKIPLYGLPAAYRGPRMLREFERAHQYDSKTGESQKVAERVELVHGDVLGGGPALQVTTASAPGPSAQRFLEVEITQRRRLSSDSLFDLSLVIDLDGAATAFHGYRLDDSWAVQADAGEFRISVVGLHWSTADLSLVLVRDLEPYIAGRNEQIARFRREQTP